MNRSLRKRKLISYYEPDEPPFDEYVYCDECRDFVYEYCSIHGELLVIPDDKVPSETGFPSFVPRAALTIPRSFLHLAQSIIPGAGLGVFSTLTLPRGVRFGPYQGRQTLEVKSMYCWQLYDANNKPHAVIDAEDASAANWMRYVNCARHWREQNLVAYQYRGRIYYRTVKIIPRFTELMVFYGSEFANLMHISLGTYNIPSHYNNTNEGTKNDINNYNDNSYKIEDSEIDYLIEEEDDTIIEYVEELRNAEDKNYDIVVYDDEVSTAASATADDNNQICIDYNLENNNLISTYNSDQTQQNNFQCHTYACAQFLQNISTQLQQYISEQCQQNTNVQLQQKINSQLQITFAQLQQNIHEQLQQIIHNQLQQNNTQFQQNSTESQQNISNFTCDLCDKQFLCKRYLNKHKLIHLKVYKFHCNDCSYKTNEKFKLRTHVGKHMKFAQKQQNILNKFTKSAQTQHNIINKFTCDVCNKEFGKRSYLTRHKYIHWNIKRFCCNYCNYKTNILNRLNEHTEIHTKNIEYRCTMCPYVSYIRRYFNNHIRTKHKEK